MGQISTNDIRQGMKVEVDGQPFNIVAIEFVKPGKGQAFNRIKMRNLKTGRVVEKTYKSGDKLDEADVHETKMRLLYTESQAATFMDDTTYDQITIHLENVPDVEKWLLEDLLYDIVFYKGEAISCEPPTFIEMEVVETDPGARGDTASGRVLKPAKMQSGASVQVPIFIDQGEKVKIDTRTGEYVSRASES